MLGGTKVTVTGIGFPMEANSIKVTVLKISNDNRFTTSHVKRTGQMKPKTRIQCFS